MSLDSFVHAVSAGRPCHIAILGFGTVGSAVARRLTGPDAIRGLQLTSICDRRADIKRAALGSESAVAWTTSIDDVLAGDADVIVETIGGIDPASAWIRRALAAGKSVVTANKQVIARDGPALQALAARQGRQLRFEAAVGGGMPIVRAIAEGLAGDRLTRVVAILNGTTNAVLSRMEATRCSFDAGLSDARARGYAEADASLDVDGGDAAAKLAIVCALAFGLRVDPCDIDTRSSAAVASADFERACAAGQTIRQIAHAAFDRAHGRLTAWVAPSRVPIESVFGRTVGAGNAAVVTGRYGGDVAMSGLGAGGDATAVAVIADIVAIARDRAAIVPAPLLSRPASISGIPNSESLIPNSEFLIPNSELAEAV